MKKIFETKRPKACTCILQQSYMVFYIDSANDALGVQNGPTTGDISSNLQRLNLTNIIISKTMSPRAFIFVCSNGM